MERFLLFRPMSSQNRSAGGGWVGGRKERFVIRIRRNVIPDEGGGGLEVKEPRHATKSMASDTRPKRAPEQQQPRTEETSRRCDKSIAIDRRIDLCSRLPKVADSVVSHSTSLGLFTHCTLARRSTI